MFLVQYNVEQKQNEKTHQFLKLVASPANATLSRSCSSFTPRAKGVHELLQTFSHKLRIDTWVPDVGEKEGAGVKVGRILSGLPGRRNAQLHNRCSCIWPGPIDTRIIPCRRSNLI